MSDFMGVTACNTPKCKEGASGVLEKILEQYSVQCDLTVVIEDGYLHFYGYDWPSVAKSKPEDDSDWDDSECLDDFLEELAPLLKETLIIQAVGNEQCCFPLSAACWVVHPDGRVIQHDLPWDVRSPECGEAVG